MIKLSDYIALRLKNHYNIDKIFLVTGGGAVHLNYSLGHHLDYYCCHHEQSLAFAAEGYSRILNKLSVVNVTTGPGGINALNGVFGQWTDSVPVLYLSGQVKRETHMNYYKDFHGRQLGDQEVDIVAMVKPITKYAVTVMNPNDIKYHLDRAIHLSTTGRFGPTWLDIPVDVQSAMIDENNLREYDPEEDKLVIRHETHIDKYIDEVIERINKAKKPLIIAGGGIHTAGAKEIFRKLADKIRIPIACSFHGIDILSNEHPSYVGLIGVHANRGANYSVQECDLLLTIGSRNDVRHVTYNFRDFAPNAYKIVVDIDEEELNKPTITPDLGIQCDAKLFIEKLFEKAGKISANHDKWYKWTNDLFKKYPNVLPEYYKLSKGVHPYVFTSELLKKCGKDDVLISTNGTCYVSILQAGYSKTGTRFFSNSGNASMGFGLPAAIGGAIALAERKAGQVFCLEGDGSMQMNIQELQTILHYKLPVKIVYFNNNGYKLIKQTQSNFFHKNGNTTFVGCDEQSGVSFPNMEKLTTAYGYEYIKVDKTENLDATLDKLINAKGAIFCEVFLGDYETVPKLSAKFLDDGKIISVPMNDMYPFLSEEEKAQNKFKE